MRQAQQETAAASAGPLVPAPPLPAPKPAAEQVPGGGDVSALQFRLLAATSSSSLLPPPRASLPRRPRQRMAQRVEGLQRHMAMRAEAAAGAGARALRDPGLLAQQAGRAAGAARKDAAASLRSATAMAQGLPAWFMEGVKGSRAPQPAANGMAPAQ
jgi:hypothetical protein